MNNVISHPAFARTPVVNARRHGPCAKPIVSLPAYRRRKYRGLGVERYNLRQWADANGMRDSLDWDDIREKKALFEAREMAMRGRYGDALRDIKQMTESIVHLFGMVRDRERRVLDLACREIVDSIAAKKGLNIQWSSDKL
jgi:hypothetical protein